MQKTKIDTGLASLVLVMGFLEMPADAEHLKHEIGKDRAATSADLIRAAKRSGLKAKSTKTYTAVRVLCITRYWSTH